MAERVSMKNIDILTKEEQYTRQLGIVDNGKLGKMSVSLIGAGSVGSFTALALSKMGIKHLEVWDDDDIELVNIPSQFYRKDSIGQKKVDALNSMISQFNPDTKITKQVKSYWGHKLPGEIIITTTDDMASRKDAFDEACRKGAWFIDARMGAELAIVYKINTRLQEDKDYYMEHWYDDDEADELPCTARTIIYNVLMLASLVCRTVKSIAMDEKDYPRETIFNMTELNKISLMLDK